MPSLKKLVLPLTLLLFTLILASCGQPDNSAATAPAAAATRQATVAPEASPAAVTEAAAATRKYTDYKKERLKSQLIRSTLSMSAVIRVTCWRWGLSLRELR